MLSDHDKVASVLLAYRMVLIETKRARFIQVQVPPVNGRHWQNCAKFFDSAEEFGVSVPTLMQIVLDNFSPWWCMKAFKRNYPGITLAVAEKSRNRALKNFPKTMVNAQPDEVVDFYVSQLKGYGEPIAVGLITNGMCGDDKGMQDMVLNKLREARIK